jgi:hypothetical protein
MADDWIRGMQSKQRITSPRFMSRRWENADMTASERLPLAEEYKMQEDWLEDEKSTSRHLPIRAILQSLTFRSLQN